MSQITDNTSKLTGEGEAMSGEQSVEEVPCDELLLSNPAVVASLSSYLEVFRIVFSLS